MISLLVEMSSMEYVHMSYSRSKSNIIADKAVRCLFASRQEGGSLLVLRQLALNADMFRLDGGCALLHRMLLDLDARNIGEVCRGALQLRGVGGDTTALPEVALCAGVYLG